MARYEKGTHFVYYGVSDTKTDETLFVGTIDEVAKFAGTTPNAIRSTICHQKKRGYNSRFFRLEDDD